MCKKPSQGNAYGSEEECGCTGTVSGTGYTWVQLALLHVLLVGDPKLVGREKLCISQGDFHIVLTSRSYISTVCKLSGG